MRQVVFADPANGPTVPAGGAELRARACKAGVPNVSNAIAALVMP